MAKRVLKIIAFFVIGAVGGIFADQILWPYFIERPLFYKYGLEQPPIYVTEIKQITVEENTALKEAIEKTAKTVVGIRTKKKNGKTVEGSGLIISSDGLVLTFADLVPADGNTLLFWEGKSPSFQVIKARQKENLALLKINESNLPTMGFADFEKLRLGERVYLVAIVFRGEEGKRNGPYRLAREGIIKLFSPELLETDIVEKSSLNASPLFNISGEVVGLNRVDVEGKVTTIPIKEIRPFLGF